MSARSRNSTAELQNDRAVCEAAYNAYETLKSRWVSWRSTIVAEIRIKIRDLHIARGQQGYLTLGAENHWPRYLNVIDARLKVASVYMGLPDNDNAPLDRSIISLTAAAR